MVGAGTPSKSCGAVNTWLTAVVPVGVPLSNIDGATRCCGVVVAEVMPAGEGPTLFVATTENLYGTPLVSPDVMEQVVVPGAGVQVTAGFSGTPAASSAVTT